MVVLICIKWVFLTGDSFKKRKKKKKHSQVQLMLTEKKFQVFYKAFSASVSSAQRDVCFWGSLYHLSLPWVLKYSGQLLKKYTILMQ